MAFTEKYTITQKYLPEKTKRRSCLKIVPSVKFVVAHDTGNPESTAAANVKYYTNSCNEQSASAHVFVDDKEIIECIPALTGPPEKAWHVLYNVQTDNVLFGYDANDAAVGVEYCYGTNINADEAYKRYLWVIANICFKFNLDPTRSIVGHFFLDPQRRTDPVTGLAHSRRTYEQFLKDIVTEFNECSGAAPATEYHNTAQTGTVTSTVKLNIRKDNPNTKSSIVKTVSPGTSLPYVSVIDNGESVNGNPMWYKDSDGNCFWSGATVKV